MLLASSITPSGRPWAVDSIERSIPGITWLEDVDPSTATSTSDGLGTVLQVAGASVISPDLVAGLTSLRSARAVASAIARGNEGRESRESVAAWFPGSVVEAVCDMQTVSTLIDVSGVVSPDAIAIEQVAAASAAVARGEVELLLVCPPEESAIARATAEVASAVATGLRVRGVAICPMPRKSDGWPASMRRAARAQAEALSSVVHPIAVDRARRGKAPDFTQPPVDACQETIDRRSDGAWIWSISIPGLSKCDVAIGTWSADIAYPTTHVVINVDGRMIRRRVDSIVRRCVAADAVVSGDSIAITFHPQSDQWPNDGGSGVTDE